MYLLNKMLEKIKHTFIFSSSPQKKKKKNSV